MSGEEQPRALPQLQTRGVLFVNVGHDPDPGEVDDLEQLGARLYVKPLQDVTPGNVAGDRRTNGHRRQRPVPPRNPVDVPLRDSQALQGVVLLLGARGRSARTRPLLLRGPTARREIDLLRGEQLGTGERGEDLALLHVLTLSNGDLLDPAGKARGGDGHRGIVSGDEANGAQLRRQPLARHFRRAHSHQLRALGTNVDRDQPRHRSSWVAGQSFDNRRCGLLRPARRSVTDGYERHAADDAFARPIQQYRRVHRALVLVGALRESRLGACVANPRAHRRGGHERDQRPAQDASDAHSSRGSLFSIALCHGSRLHSRAAGGWGRMLAAASSLAAGCAAACPNLRIGPVYSSCMMCAIDGTP